MKVGCVQVGCEKVACGRRGWRSGRVEVDQCRRG